MITVLNILHSSHPFFSVSTPEVQNKTKTKNRCCPIPIKLLQLITKMKKKKKIRLPYIAFNPTPLTCHTCFWTNVRKYMLVNSRPSKYQLVVETGHQECFLKFRTLQCSRGLSISPFTLHSCLLLQQSPEGLRNLF